VDDRRPDVPTLEEAARKLQEDSEPELRTAQKALALAQQALNEAKIHEAELEGRHERRREEIEAFDRRLKNLRGDGKSDALRHQELQQAALEWDAQKAAVENLVQTLGPYPADPAALATTLQLQMEEAVRERDSARDELRDEETRVRQLSSAAPYSMLTQAEEKLEAILTQLRDEEARMEATSLLYQTVGRCRSEAIKSIPTQVAHTATAILHRVAGTAVGSVCVSEVLAPTQVLPPGAVAALPLADLSGGEKEQVSFAVRIALAEELARSERQLVVFDDSLMASDSDRFERILDVLRESTEHLQILILTCHPERYQLLPGAKLHDLEMIVQTSTRTEAHP